MVITAASLSLALAGCVGDTDFARHIRATRATLSAHGSTNNGPARWWWEYSTRKSTVANGGGTPTPMRGPASSASTVPLSEVVNGLDPDQPYYFRACAQDTAAGSPVTCGRVLLLRTAATDSTVNLGGAVLHYTASPNAYHESTISIPATGPGVVRERIRSTLRTDPPFVGSTFTPGSGCTAVDDDPDVDAPSGFDAAARCGTAASSLGLDARFGPYIDRVAIDSPNPTSVHGGGGSDELNGGSGPDQIYGDDGDDVIRGRGGGDVLNGGPGNDELEADSDNTTLSGGPGDDTFSCFGSNDFAITDSPGEAAQAAANGCVVGSASSTRARAARR